jgi:hypothetical protein
MGGCAVAPVEGEIIRAVLCGCGHLLGSTAVSDGSGLVLYDLNMLPRSSVRGGMFGGYESITSTSLEAS